MKIIMDFIPTIIFILFLLVSLIIICLAKKNIKIKNAKKICYFFLIAYFFMFILIDMVDYFITFSTPEKAYHYVTNEKIKIKLEGQKSILFLSENNQNIYINKINNKYKVTHCNAKTYAIPGISLMLTVINVKNTNDYYIELFGINPEVETIEDNLGVEFIDISNNSKVAEYIG